MTAQHAERMDLLIIYFLEDLAKTINQAGAKDDKLPDPNTTRVYTVLEPVQSGTYEEIVYKTVAPYSRKPGTIVLFVYKQEELVAMFDFDGSLIVKPLSVFYDTEYSQFPKSHLRYTILASRTSSLANEVQSCTSECKFYTLRK